MKDKLKILPVIFLVFVTLWLRLVNLGYSNYQGDEIKALSLPFPGQNFIDFLFQQRKGPTQFIITYLIKLVNPTFTNEFLTRLPFALAGILAIFFFYRMVKLNFGTRIALYASIFLAVNGLFVGLNRIVQYQPFVILFSILAIYAISLAIKRKRWKVGGLYLGMLFWGIAVLSHYDGLFIAPFVIYLLVRWYTSNVDLPVRTRQKHILLSSGIFILIPAIFYVPFVFSITERTRTYWSARLEEPIDVDTIKSSLITFKIYNPLIVIYLYAALGLLSILKIRKTFPVILWFIFPWLVLEGIIYDPGTHIYTYLIPATILIAFGAAVIEDVLEKVAGEVYGSVLSRAGLAILFIFLFTLSHFIFIDHTPEYPWEERKYLIWTLEEPDQKYKLWLYGFPYYRYWDEIVEYITSSENNGFYSTNEKKSISEYYVPYEFNVNKSVYYIHIHNPQRLRERLAKDKIRYWRKNYPPVKVFEYRGRIVAEIYLMPKGDVSEIKKAGY
jgi:4-amino-4-deoxy-L-arabinose transferase-like glycosyltransferase